MAMSTPRGSSGAAPSPRERRIGMGRTNRSENAQVYTLTPVGTPRKGTPLLPPVPGSPRPPSLKGDEGVHAGVMWTQPGKFPPGQAPPLRKKGNRMRGTPLVDRIRRAREERENEEVVPLIKQQAERRAARPSTGYTKKVANDVMEKIRRVLADKTRSMHKVFRKYDTDSSGNICLEEFHAAIKGMNLPVTKTEAELVFNNIDQDASGTIEYTEFCHQLGENNESLGGIFVGGGEAAVATKAEDLIREGGSRVARSKANQDALFDSMRADPTAFGGVGYSREVPSMTEDEKVAFTRSLLQKLKRKMVDKSSSALKLFRIYDADKDGSISMDEFRNVLRGLNMNLRTDEIEAVVDSVDIDKNGGLNYTEFCDQFAETFEDNGGTRVGEGLGRVELDIRKADHTDLPPALGAVAAQLHRGTHPVSVPRLLKVLRSHDKARSGQLPLDAFRRGMSEVLASGNSGIEQRDLDGMGWEDGLEDPRAPVDYVAFCARVKALAGAAADYTKGAHLGRSWEAQGGAGGGYGSDPYARALLAGGSMSDRGSLRLGSHRGSPGTAMSTPHSSRLPSRSGHVPQYDPMANTWSSNQARPIYPRTETMHIFKPRRGTAAFADDVVRHTTVNGSIAQGGGRIDIGPGDPPGTDRSKEIKFQRMRQNHDRVLASYHEQEVRDAALKERRYENVKALRERYVARLLEQAIWHERFDHRDQFADIRYAPKYALQQQ